MLSMPPSVLFVHASTDDRAMYAEYLRAHQVTVVEVSTTDAALWQLPYVDAVITGLMVPGTLDAFELIRQVRLEWGANQSWS